MPKGFVLFLFCTLWPSNKMETFYIHDLLFMFSSRGHEAMPPIYFLSSHNFPQSQQSRVAGEYLWPIPMKTTGWAASQETKHYAVLIKYMKKQHRANIFKHLINAPLYINSSSLDYLLWNPAVWLLCRLLKWKLFFCLSITYYFPNKIIILHHIKLRRGSY